MNTETETRTATNTIKEGQVLVTRSIVDADSFYTAYVMRRTKSSVTVRIAGAQPEVRRCKVRTEDDGEEYIMPWGKYSMATVFRAGKLLDGTPRPGDMFRKGNDLIKVKQVTNRHVVCEFIKDGTFTHERQFDLDRWMKHVIVTIREGAQFKSEALRR